MKKQIFYLLILSLIGCSKPWKASKENFKVMLPDVSVIKGKHCESSAINNAMNYLGYNVNESMIVGGGGAVSFIYERSDFPFIGARNYKMREIFFNAEKIEWHVEKPQDAISSWTGVKNILSRGLPVILRVDMKYLPYLHNGKYGKYSFGWHIITLFGMDTEKGIAWVSDTENEGLQVIELKDIEKARSSKTDIFPPEREYYWIEKKTENHEIDWQKLTNNSIKEVISNMETSVSPKTINTFTGLNGLKNFGKEIIGIENSVKSYMLPVIFNFWYGCIETNGTGGAGFRVFYKNFLIEAGAKLKDKKITNAVKYLDDSINAWHNLSNEFKVISEKIGSVKNKEQRMEMYKKAAVLSDILYEKEKIFYEYLKNGEKSAVNR